MFSSAASRTSSDRAGEAAPRRSDARSRRSPSTCSGSSRRHGSTRSPPRPGLRRARPSARGPSGTGPTTSPRSTAGRSRRSPAPSSWSWATSARSTGSARSLPLRLVALVVVTALAVGSWLVLGPGRPQPPPCAGVEVGLDDDLQEAIDGSPAGTTFCLAAGTYVIEEPIETKDGTELMGEGMGVTVLHSEGANIVIDAARDRDVAISHLDLADAHGSRACRPQCGSGLHGGSGVVVDSVAFYDNENHGLGGAEDLVVTNSVFHHNGSRGFTGCCAGGLKSGSGFRIEYSKIYE